MYVKVAGIPVVMFDVGDCVQWGVHIINDGREELGDPDWRSELGIDFESYSARVTSGPDEPDVHGSPLWSIRYAYWDTESGIEGVVANSAVYILGDNGKTIDRV